MYQRSWRRRKTDKERENIFVEGELLFLGRREKKEEKERRYLEKENIFYVEEKKTANEKEEYIWRTKINGDVDDNQPTERANIVQTALSKVRR